MLINEQNTPLARDIKEKPSGSVMTLRARLMLLVLVAMLPALAVIISTAVEQYHHRKAEARESVRKLARLAVNYHESLIEETRYLLSSMAEIPQLRDLRSGACDAVLKELLFGNPHYANLGVIRPDGEVACSAVPSVKRVNVGDRPYFQAAMDTKRLSVGAYQIGRFVKKPVQIVALPILDSERRVQAVVYAALNLSGLMRFTPLPELPPGSAITVVDRDGVILSRVPDPEGRWAGAKLEELDHFASRFIASGHAQSIDEGLGVDGIPRIYALTRIGSEANSQGYILIGTPSKALYAEVDEALVAHVTFFAAAFITIMLVAWFGSEVIILKRMRMLSEATRRMGSGDLSSRALVGGRDEIAKLAVEFNVMGETLQKDRHQIQRLNRLHEVLSGINGAILRIRNHAELAQEACRIAVERGGLRFAWIGLIDSATGHISKLATHGNGEGFLHEHCLTAYPKGNHEHCPCIMAVPEERPVVYNDLDSEPENVHWIEQARKYGFRAIAGLPLHRDGRVVGVLGLYSDEANFFDTPETELFLELAADISLGFEYLDKDERIAHLLYHDALTGLPNRKLCEDRLQQTIARARHHSRYVGIVVLNVTDFHRVVGVYGHHVADETLNRVANHLRAHVREGDTVARLEGDEFAVILADVASMQDVVRLANALISGLPNVVQGPGVEIHLPIRAGVAISPTDGEAAPNLLGNATLACNSNKGNQTHMVSFYSAEIQLAAKDREKFEQALRRAVNENVGLELHYQPVVDIVSHKIISLEALARWNSLEFGQVPPSRFIPVAEETGLIMPLGDWVLDAARRQIGIWRKLGINEIHVAINVSFRQLNSMEFIERLCGRIDTELLHCQNHLAVELTESELMNNIEMTIQQIQSLKDKKFTIYVDDFGTGYSSLSYLQRLPVDVLKIDQSFVGELTQSDGSAAIVRAIIALAKSLNLRTIAEGVETSEQLQMLQDLGCDYVQGYLFSKPKPPDEITELLEAGGHLAPTM